MSATLRRRISLGLFGSLLVGSLGLLGWYDVRQNAGAQNSPIVRQDDPSVDGVCGVHGFRVWYQPIGGSIAKVLPDPTCAVKP